MVVPVVRRPLVVLEERRLAAILTHQVLMVLLILTQHLAAGVVLAPRRVVGLVGLVLLLVLLRVAVAAVVAQITAAQYLVAAHVAKFRLPIPKEH
jgi:hypothetical protein